MSWKAIDELIEYIEVVICSVHLEGEFTVYIFLCLPWQTEHHPHCVQSELIEFCRQTGIFYQAYSSLGTTTSNNPVRWVEGFMGVAFSPPGSSHDHIM